MESPYAARESEEHVTADVLAKRLRAFEPASSMNAPGSVSGLEGQDLEEFVELLEPNFHGTITRVYEPYGSEISRHLGKASTSRSVAVLLRGVVEIQAPFTSGRHERAKRDSFYPFVVLRAPALIGLFEATPEATIYHHQVRIFAGVQSFTILLSLAQIQPWKKIARRHSTNFPYGQLKTSGGHTTLFRWSRGRARAPRFVQIAQGRPDWNVELALLNVDAIFRKRYSELTSNERHLRDLLYRAANRQFGDSLKRHVPGYRTHSDSDSLQDIAENIQSVATFLREIDKGEQPHHTCCSKFHQLCNLLPAKTLIWNIYDFIRLAAGQSIDITKFGVKRKSTKDELELDILTRFFNDCLYRYIYVPSFCASEDVCLYSPVLWPYDDNNSLLEDFDPGNVGKLQNVLAKKLGRQVDDLHIKTIPDFFNGSPDFGGLVPKTISEIVMEGGLFFRKRSESGMK